MSEARIRWISGPVLRAGTSDPFHVHEAIGVGADALLGEIVQLGADEIVAQVYEDTTGLKPGDAVTGTGQALSAKLGPGLLAGIACNGRGIAMTTMLGRVLADWAKGAALADLPVPSGPPAPLRLHGLARFAPNALLPLGMLRDAMEARFDG